jgi:hypothetical protein
LKGNLLVGCGAVRLELIQDPHGGDQECTMVPRLLFCGAYILCIILSVFPLLHINVYQFTCTKHKVPDGSEVYRLFQNCGSLEWNFHHIILLASGIWTWLLNFWKIFGCLALTVSVWMCNQYSSQSML